MKTRKFFCRLKQTTALLLVLAIVMGPAAVYGAEDSEVPGEEIPAEEGDYQVDEVYAIERTTNYFLTGMSKITYLGDKVMGVTSTTMATQLIDRVTALAMLERYYNGQWMVYKLVQVDKYNDIAAAAGLTYEVPGGYAYRAHGIHMVTHNYQQTRKETVTDSLWLAQ